MHSYIFTALLSFLMSSILKTSGESPHSFIEFERNGQNVIKIFKFYKEAALVKEIIFL